MYGMCITHGYTKKIGDNDSQSKDTDCKHGRGYKRSQTGYLQSGVRRVPDEKTGITAEELAECGIMGEEANSDD